MNIKLNKTQPLFIKILDFMVHISLAICTAWFIAYSFAYKVTNTGQSMLPLIGVNEGVLVNRLAYVFDKPERFDIIAFKSSENDVNVKRIIGLPGETVVILEGIVYINGNPLDTSNVVGKDLEKAALEGIASAPVILKDDEYFVLGDNRESSEDSRFSKIGNVKRKLIIGKLWLRIIPLKRIGYLY